jgi:hydrogenase-4 component F
MPLQWLIVFFAWGGAAALAAVPNLRHATLANVVVSGMTFMLALAMASEPYAQHGWTHTDTLNLPFILVSTFIGLTTAVFSAATLDRKASTIGASAPIMPPIRSSWARSFSRCSPTISA